MIEISSLDDDLAEAHASLGQILVNYDYDFKTAEREYRRAIELNPNYATAHQWYGEVLANLGRFDESQAEFDKALAIDPLSLIINREKGGTLFFERKYDASIELLKKTVELDPNFLGPHYDLFLAYHMKGNYPESVEEFAKWRELNGDRGGAAQAREAFRRGGWRGFLKAMTAPGRPPGLAHYHFAIFYIALGENEAAISELVKAYDERENDMNWMNLDPRLDPVRSDPRFQELLKKVGFPE
ncbi:MAG: tetratricopeptide repeat protein [Pyrinomonadaceae bacterium]